MDMISRVQIQQTSLLFLTGFLLLFTLLGCNSDISGTDNIGENTTENTSGEEASGSIKTCGEITENEFSVLEMYKILRVTYLDAEVNDVVSWGSSNPKTSTLDYIGDGWAYYRNRGIGYVEIEITINDGENICTSTHVLDY